MAGCSPIIVWAALLPGALIAIVPISAGQLQRNFPGSVWKGPEKFLHYGSAGDIIDSGLLAGFFVP